MSISVTCPHGHKLKAKDSHAGRTLKCPACGAAIIVPTSQADVFLELDEANTPLDETLGDGDDIFNVQEPSLPKQTPTTLARPATTTPVSKPSHQTGNLKLFLVLGGMAGGAVLGLCVLLVVWLVSRSGRDQAGTNAVVVGAGQQADAVADHPQAPAEGSNRKASPLAGLREPTEDIRGISDKLRRIGLAFHGFHDTHKIFAFPRARDMEVLEPHRRPQPTELSWRVHLLPYVEQKPLYDQFHLDEPWDSPHNLPLLDKMPELYRIQSSDKSTTRFQVITGPGRMFGNPKPLRMADVPDGMRHTILAVVTGPDRAVPWTKPDEVSLDSQTPLASLGTLPDRLVMCVMVDGQPLIFHDDIEPENFLAMTTPNGREVIDAETYRRQWEEQQGGLVENLRRGLSELIPKSRPQTNAVQPLVATPAANRPSASKPSSRNERMQKLKEIVLAMHNFHDTYRQFPLPKGSKYFAPDGKPYLSWRVHLLPFVDQQPLYSQFKLDEPWDSPHNRKLLDKMPDIFSDPQDQRGGTTTRFVTFTGPETPFANSEGLRFRDFRDGTSTTLLIVTVGADKAVPWTAPVDVEFEPAAPVASLGKLEDAQIFYARADGAVKVLRGDIPNELFKAIVTPAGGELLSQELAAFEVQ